MQDHVDVEFKPARRVKQHKQSYWLSAEGEPELQLPVSQTTLTRVDTPEGSLAVSARIPRFIASLAGTYYPP